MNLFERLRLFLLLRVGEAEDADPSPGDESSADPTEGTGDETLDDLLDDVEPTPGKTPIGDEKDNALVKEARRRADEAERQLADERAARARDREAAPLRPAAQDAEYEREEALLAQARKDGKDTSWLEWQIDSNRKIRASERNSSAALREAQDVADKTAFERLEITKPQVYKRYATRVEQTVAEAVRRDGRAPPRLAVLRLLIGDDIMNGKIKPKAAKQVAGETTEVRVDRGRTQPARTDVRPKGGLTEQQKRAARLEGQII